MTATTVLLSVLYTYQRHACRGLVSLRLGYQQKQHSEQSEAPPLATIVWLRKHGKYMDIKDGAVARHGGIDGVGNARMWSTCLSVVGTLV